MRISRSHLTANVVLSVGQVIISGVLLFLLYRFLLRQLGPERLGLWAIILASASIVRLTDFGLTASVVKFIASHRARGDERAASVALQTIAISVAGFVGILMVCVAPLSSLIIEHTLSGSYMEDVRNILPFAFASLWVNANAGVFLSGLDACQEARVRNGILIAAGLLFFAMAVLLTPRFGLVALAWAQLVQAAFSMVAAWCLLRRHLSLPYVPVQFSWRELRKMLGYSISFQVTSAAALLIDPLTKLLMAKFGGLAMAGYYDMASQFVIKVRSLLVAANQVLVPVVAEEHAVNPIGVRAIYYETYKAVFLGSTLVYSAIIMAMPLISHIWIGHVRPDFIIFGTALSLAYFVNNIEVPAHFENIATGRLGWNTAANIGMAAMNVAIGALLGYRFGGYGVLVGLATSISAGSALVLVIVHRRHGLTVSDIVPAIHRRVVLACLVAVVAFLVGVEISGASVDSQLVVSTVSLLGLGASVCILLIGHPYSLKAIQLARLRADRHT